MRLDAARLMRRGRSSRCGACWRIGADSPPADGRVHHDARWRGLGSPIRPGCCAQRRRPNSASVTANVRGVLDMFWEMKKDALTWEQAGGAVVHERVEWPAKGVLPNERHARVHGSGMAKVHGLGPGRTVLKLHTHHSAQVERPLLTGVTRRARCVQGPGIADEPLEPEARRPDTRRGVSLWFGPQPHVLWAIMRAPGWFSELQGSPP